MIALSVIAATVLLTSLWTVVSIASFHGAASKLYLLDVTRDAGDPVSVKDFVIRDKQATRV